MNDAKREILAKVAAGSISAIEGAAELEELERPRSGPITATAPAAPGSPSRVKVLATMGSVTVIGDDSVQEAVAEGPHFARREGDTIVIQTDDDNTVGAFIFGGRGRFGFDRKDRRVIVRMNPRLPLAAEIQAGSLRIQGVLAHIRAEVQAGSTRIEGFAAPLDLDVQAGSVRASGILTAGASRIQCQAGSVRVELDPASSVRITARTSLGRVTLPGGGPLTSVGGGTSEARLGDGEASLDIVNELGSVQVSSGQ